MIYLLKNAPAFNIQPSMMSQTSVRASGPMSHPLSPMSHPWGLNIPQTHLLQRNAALHKQPLSLSFNQGINTVVFLTKKNLFFCFFLCFFKSSVLLLLFFALVSSVFSYEIEGGASNSRNSMKIAI